jgi:hypothetical protein
MFNCFDFRNNKVIVGWGYCLAIDIFLLTDISNNHHIFLPEVTSVSHILCAYKNHY